eukprot:TRINITY_DN21350_c0_g1_i1.p1 TRINITY_DN21350_c0_g1~~TRINITY_DN21350_c0_g1_i1.p1  ORF type:complete len:499 (-),score=77.13 TRINITY_DN21350_c0_g1_i1:27-1523(-)
MATPKMEGYLSIFRLVAWYKVYFVLDSAEKLLWFGTKQRCPRCIDLRTVSVSFRSDSTRHLQLVASAECKWVLRAATPELCQQWVVALQKAQGVLNEDGTPVAGEQSWENICVEDLELISQQAQQGFDQLVASENPDRGTTHDWVVVSQPAARVSHTDFVPLHVLGKGSYGTVLLVRKKDTGKLYAMKTIRKRNVLDKFGGIRNVFTERSVLRRTWHPFVAQAHFTFQTPDKLFFVMDYYEGGDLEKYVLRNGGRLTEEQARFFLCEVLVALAHIHKLRIIYRDLKPHNVLLDRDGHICLSDFGLSKDFELDNRGDGRASSMVGSPYYIAPELLLGKPYGLTVDYWGLGVLFYRMVMGRVPFRADTMPDLFQKILHDPVSFDPMVARSAAAEDLMRQLLCKDETKRPTTFETVSAHPWFEGVDWDAVLAKKASPPGWTSPEGSSGGSGAPQALTPPASPLDYSQQLCFAGFSSNSPSCLTEASDRPPRLADVAASDEL